VIGSEQIIQRDLQNSIKMTPGEHMAPGRRRRVAVAGRRRSPRMGNGGRRSMQEGWARPAMLVRWRPA
jgi:hypothetical protein